jgi:hypothetical protein
MKKQYKIEHRDTLWSCEVEVDDEFTFPDFFDQNKKMHPIDVMTSMVEFWTDWEGWLSFYAGDYKKTFLQQLGREVFYILAAERLNLTSIIAAFKNREGWCDVDGSYGIKIVQIDPLSFDHYEFEVEEVQE